MDKRLEFKTTVSKVGNPEDYIHLPVIDKEIAIGVIVDAVEVENGYELTFILRNSGLQILNNKPMAFVVR